MTVIESIKGRWPQPSPLTKLIEPDYEGMFFDLLTNETKKNSYMILCPDCDLWKAATGFKHHVAQYHGVDDSMEPEEFRTFIKKVLSKQELGLR